MLQSKPKTCRRQQDGNSRRRRHRRNSRSYPACHDPAPVVSVSGPQQRCCRQGGPLDRERHRKWGPRARGQLHFLGVSCGSPLGKVLAAVAAAGGEKTGQGVVDMTRRRMPMDAVVLSASCFGFGRGNFANYRMAQVAAYWIFYRPDFCMRKEVFLLKGRTQA